MSIDISRISVTYVLYLKRGARSPRRPYISDEQTGYRMCSNPFVVYPSSFRPFPGCSSSFYSRGSPVRLSVPLLSARRWHHPGEAGGGGGSLEVSLTILRNFADSLARVDHVRPVLRSHGSCREGENGFSRGSEKGLKEERAREASRARLRRGHGWRTPRVVSSRCPKICIRDGYADWKRDWSSRAPPEISFSPWKILALRFP